MRERKLQASLLSIKMFWAPELEKERRAKISERKRADKAEEVLKLQLEKGVKYMQKLMELEQAYEELEQSSQKQTQLESDLRAQLEEQLKRQTQARIQRYSQNDTVRLEETVRQLEYELQKTEKELIEASDSIGLLQDRLVIANKRADENAGREAELMTLKTELKTAKDSAADADGLRQLCVKLRQSSNKITAELETTNKDNQRLQAMTEQLQIEQNELMAKHNEEVRTKSGKNLELTKEVAAQNAEVSKLQAQVYMLTGEKDELQQSLADIQNDEIDREQVVLTNTLEIERLTAEVANLLQDVALRTEEVDAAQLLTDSLEDSLAESKEQLAAEIAEREALAIELNISKETVEELTADLKAQKEAVKTAKKSVQKQSDLKGKLDEFLSSIQELERQLDVKDAENAQLKADLDAKSAEKSKGEKSIAASETRLHSLQSDLKKAKKDLRNAHDQSRGLTERVHELTTQLAAVKKEAEEEAAKHKAAKTVLTRKNKALQAETSALQKKARDSEEKASIQHKETASLAAKLVKEKKLAQTEKANREKLSSGHKEKLDELVAGQAELRTQLQNKTNENVLLSQQVSSAENKVATLTSELEGIRASHEHLDEESRTMRGKVAEMEASKSKASGELQALKLQILEKSEKIRELEIAIEDAEENAITDKTNSILAAIADLDSQIAALEVDGADKNKLKIETLLERRSQHVEDLKVQFDKRSALMEPTSDEEIAPPKAETREEMLETLEVRQTETSGVRDYIDQLVSQVKAEGGEAVQSILKSLPLLPEKDSRTDFTECTDEEIQNFILSEGESHEQLENYVDTLLNQILTHCPSLLESGTIAIASP